MDVGAVGEPVGWVGEPDVGARQRADDHEHLPHEQRREDKPVADLDRLVQPQRKEHREHQQAVVDDEFASEEKQVEWK